MISLDRAGIEQAIARLHDAPQMAYVVCTGAGAGVTELLWSVAGCSRTLIAGEFPYNSRAFANLIGRIPAQYTSTEAAIALATAAYLKGQRCLVEAGGLSIPLVALGLTAAVSTDRRRRGDDRVFAAVRTASGLATVAVIFERGYFSREQEGVLCDLLAIDCLLWAAGIGQIPLPASHLRSAELGAAGDIRPAEVTLSLEGVDLPVVIDEEGNLLDPGTLAPDAQIIFPGSFNPLHFGHDLFAQTVAAMTGRRVVFELAAANADKPEVGRQSLAERALQFRGRWPVLLAEHLPRFIDKARVYGGFSFIVGLDTAVRLFDPKYFAGEAERDAAAAEFRALGTKFYVCNRGEDPAAFTAVIEDPETGDLFVPVPMVIHVSSTDLRSAIRP